MKKIKESNEISKVMQPLRCPVTHMAGPESSPMSPRQNGPSSSRNSPAAERLTSATSPSETIASPKPDCAICLGKMKNESFTDSCLHQFCFFCLLQWSKVKPECPLCKQNFKSIIHNVRSIEDYDEYRLPTGTENPDARNSTVNLEIVQRFRYRTTLTSDRRLERVLEHLAHDLQHRVDHRSIIPTYTSWHLQRSMSFFDFRVSVYRDNLWVNSLLTFGRPRDISHQRLRRHPEEIQRLLPWLIREMYAILRSPGLASHALDRVLSLLQCHDVHSRQFWSGMESYLRNHCDHFIHEFYNFARSHYDMIGFDENAVYSSRNNMQIHEVHDIDSGSSDSDVVIVLSDDSEPLPASLSKRNSAVVPRSTSPIAGPSRAVLPVDEPSLSEANIDSSSESSSSLPPVLQDLTGGRKTTETKPSQCSERSDSDSCVLVGYVKPLHERTPEIISLSSSDPEDDVKESSQEGTALYDCSYSHIYSSPSSSLESSGSEYKPHTVRKSQKKKVNQRGKCDGRAKCKAKTCHSKTTATSTKKRGSTKPEYSSSDSDSSVASHNGKRSIWLRKARSISNSSSVSGASSSSSSYKPTYTSRKSSSSRTDRSTKRSLCNDKRSWRIKIKVPGVKQEHDYSVVGFESRNSSDSVARSRSRSGSRPKLRSIVITHTANGSGRHQTPADSSHDKPQKRLPKKGESHKQDGAVKKVKDELIKVEDEFGTSPATSSSYLHHKGSSQLSHSSKHEGSGRYSSRSSNRKKHSNKEKKKVKSKRQRDSDSSTGRKSRGLKSKKRKIILSSFSDSSVD